MDFWVCTVEPDPLLRGEYLALFMCCQMPLAYSRQFHSNPRMNCTTRSTNSGVLMTIIACCTILSVSCKPVEEKVSPAASEIAADAAAVDHPVRAQTKKISIDSAALGSVYPAIWFSPGEGELIPIATLSESPPEERCEIWIEPRDAEFSFAKGLTEVGMAVVGNGEPDFDKFTVPGSGQFVRKLPADALAEGKEPVIFIQGKGSQCLVLLRQVNSAAADWRIEMLWRELKLPPGAMVGIKPVPPDLRPIGLQGKVGDPTVTELFGQVIVGKGQSPTGELIDVGMCLKEWTVKGQRYGVALGFAGGKQAADISRITFTPMGPDGLPMRGEPEEIMKMFAQGKSWAELPKAGQIEGYGREDGAVYVVTEGHWISIMDATEFDQTKRAKVK